MNFDQVKEHFGSVPAAAKALGMKRQGVYRWDKAGIPVGAQYRIQVLTGGKLRAEEEEKKAA
jgi:hypothetical protein